MKGPTWLQACVWHPVQDDWLLGSAGATAQSTHAGLSSTVVSGSWTSCMDQCSSRRLSKNQDMEASSFLRASPGIQYNSISAIFYRSEVTESHIFKAKGHTHPDPKPLDERGIKERVVIFNTLHLARFPQGNTSWVARSAGGKPTQAAGIYLQKSMRSARKRGVRNTETKERTQVWEYKETGCGVISKHRL